MFQFIKNIFGPKVDLRELIVNGAVIVDVRSRAEYAAGHVKGSLNIPLDQLAANLGKLKQKDRPVITCCASGMRSGSAVHVLKGKGYTQVYNGGSWYSLERYCN